MYSSKVVNGSSNSIEKVPLEIEATSSISQNLTVSSVISTNSISSPLQKPSSTVAVLYSCHFLSLLFDIQAVLLSAIDCESALSITSSSSGTPSISFLNCLPTKGYVGVTIPPSNRNLIPKGYTSSLWYPVNLEANTPFS